MLSRMCSEDHGLAAPAAGRLLPRPIEGEAWEPVPLEPVDRVTITTLVDNTFDALAVDQGPARRGHSRVRLANPVFEGEASDMLHAEHGFSALVTVTKGERVHRLLFDTGVSPTGMTENMRRLEIDPGDIEVIVLSHGHFDHTGGMAGLITALGRTNLPLLIHPEFWSRRRIALPGTEPREIPTTSKRALTDAGFTIVERRDPSFLLDSSILVTGEVDRATDFEHGFRGHESWRAGHWEPDPLILDDQALVVDVAGRGLVVLTGCGHAGMVNIVRYAQRLTGVERVHAVLGGFHLSGPQFETVIGPTVHALADIGPDVVVPAHCTGWRASHQLAVHLPDALVPNTVGTTFVMEAA
jgi:7,8-dihydropterin-6-yl-methyl-4-(beta-D-ribofuranosyl)aminobenzene 5'-phosphate synthase